MQPVCVVASAAQLRSLSGVRAGHDTQASQLVELPLRQDLSGPGGRKLRPFRSVSSHDSSVWRLRRQTPLRVHGRGHDGSSAGIWLAGALWRPCCTRRSSPAPCRPFCTATSQPSTQVQKFASGPLRLAPPYELQRVTAPGAGPVISRQFHEHVIVWTYIDELFPILYSQQVDNRASRWKPCGWCRLRGTCFTRSQRESRCCGETLVQIPATAYQEAGGRTQRLS